MKSNSYSLSPQAIQFYVERAHQMRKEFIVTHLHRAFAALANGIRKIAQPSANRLTPTNFYTPNRMWDA